MTDQLALLPDATPRDATPRDDAVSREPAGSREPAPSRQLSVPWELDDHTRHVGRQGLAAARQALRQASARQAA